MTRIKSTYDAACEYPLEKGDLKSGMVVESKQTGHVYIINDALLAIKIYVGARGGPSSCNNRFSVMGCSDFGLGSRFRELTRVDITITK